MEDISGFPVFSVHYDRDGRPRDSEHRSKLNAFLSDHDLDDLLVLSHGWNNSESEAKRLYVELGASLALQRDAVAGLEDRRIGLMCVFWPSKKFQAFDKPDIAMVDGATSAVPATPKPVDPMTAAEVFIDECGLSGDEAAAFRQSVAQASASTGAFEEFMARLRRLLPPDALQERADEGLTAEIDGQSLLARLGSVESEDDDDGVSWEDGDGGAAGPIGRGATGAVGTVLNYGTFYLMKHRAGLVGANGVAATLAGVRSGRPGLRLHLSGHSFGARLLTMAAKTIAGDEGARPNSLCLLQAAFSHNSFSTSNPPGRGGFFRSVLANKGVTGPIVVTHTHNDWPVRVAYATASALAGHDASFLTGQPGQYGGLGANGAQHTDEAVNLTTAPPGEPDYVLRAGVVYNLLSDSYISSHSDVRGEAVALAICAAMAS